MQLQGTEIMIGVITINASTTWEELANIVQTSFRVSNPTFCYTYILRCSWNLLVFDAAVMNWN